MTPADSAAGPTPGEGGGPWAVVVHSLGGPGLPVLLDALAAADADAAGGPVDRPALVVVVDDRELTGAGSGPEALRLPSEARGTGPAVEPVVERVVVRSGGRGPEAARDLGWRTAVARVDGLRRSVFLTEDAVLPPAAVGARLVDRVGAAGDLVATESLLRGSAAAAAGREEPLAAVLFDRDGTLVHDVPYNGDPALVRLVDGAGEALARVRAAGLRTGMVTNQSGVARGIITRAQADAVTAEVVRQLGGLDVVVVCPHGPDDGCACRKPGPGMVVEAARRLGVPTSRVAVVGDIGADVGAALAAGARGVMVPTPVTRSTEVAAARAAAAAGGPVLGVAADLSGAVDLLLGDRS